MWIESLELVHVEDFDELGATESNLVLLCEALVVAQRVVMSLNRPTIEFLSSERLLDIIKHVLLQCLRLEVFL